MDKVIDKPTETTGSYADEQSRWEAVQQRDAGADGVFWYSVRSTGVYCWPPCGRARPCARTWHHFPRCYVK